MSRAKRVNPSLKNVAIAVEPITQSSSSFEIYSQTIKHFQSHSLLPSVSILSMIHSALYMVHNSWYYENEDRFAAEAKQQITELCSGQFNSKSVHIIKAKVPANEQLVEEMSEYLKKIRANLVVVFSNNRTGLPYWFLGSFAETAALTATIPILIMKPQINNTEFSKKPLIVVAVDAATTYSVKHLKWISEFAYPAQATLELVYVKPNTAHILSSIRKPEQRSIANNELKKLQKALEEMGLKVTLSMLPELETVAHTIVEFAEKKKAWTIITIFAQRKLVRRLLLGSTARKVLSLTNRPFLNLRIS